MKSRRSGSKQTSDPDAGKGAVEQDRPEQKTNVAPLRDQQDHRARNKLIKSTDTDFPEPGLNPEYSMQKEDANKNQLNNQVNQDPDGNGGGVLNNPDDNPEGRMNDQDPGHRQKENQNQKADDDLAA